MKTLTIELNNDLERQVELLSRQTGREETVVILEVLRKGLLEDQSREQMVRALEEVSLRPVPWPFDTMTDEEVMQVVEEEIAVHRAEDGSASNG